MPTPPKSMLAVCLVVSALLGVSAAAGLALCVMSQPMSWITFGFEGLVLFSSVFGVLVGLGKFRDGPALAILCVAGAVAVSSLFGYFGADRSLGGFGLKIPLFARWGAAAALTLVAGVIVLSRDWPASRGRLAKGIIAGGLLVALLAGAYMARGRIASLGDLPRVLLAMGGFAVVTALLAATAQWLITAFEKGSASRFDDASGTTASTGT